MRGKKHTHTQIKIITQMDNDSFKYLLSSSYFSGYSYRTGVTEK